MKKTLLLVLAGLVGFSVQAAAEDWSRNNVIKFTPELLKKFDRIRDYENVAVTEGGIFAVSPTNAWLQSYPIEIGADSVLASAFINLEVTNPSSKSYAVLKVRNAGNDSLIQKKTFYRSGKIDLQNIFRKTVTVGVELYGTDVRLLSFGLTRKPEVIITADTNDLLITPPVLFYNEKILRIDFSLRYPAVLDVILFDRNGKIVDSIARKSYFSEGTNTLFWYPGKNSATGRHQVYFKVVAIDGKEVELIKDFIFVKD